MSAWPSGVSFHTEPLGDSSHHAIDAFKVQVRNASPIDVREVVIRVHIPGLPSTGPVTNPVAIERRPTLPPTESVVTLWVSPPAAVDVSGFPAADHRAWADEIRVDMAFRDSRGVKWLRGIDGQLRKVG